MKLRVFLGVPIVAVVFGCGGEDGPTTPNITVTVEPSTATVHVGQTQQFTATVTGTTNTAVTWSVEGGGARGTISESGLYTAPGTLPTEAAATVKTTSQADPTKSSTAMVTIVDPAPLDFVLVPAGSFTMGDDGAPCGATQYPVTLTEDFYLGQTEVTNQQYIDMLNWAWNQNPTLIGASSISVWDSMGSGQELVSLDYRWSEIAFSGGVFSLRNAGYGINPHHPVKAVTWYGAVSYCDWLSLREGRPRAYDHTTWSCNEGDPYRALGYRLPTDAEWEYAAQYGDERIYPWGNEAPSCDRANYYGCNNNGWTEPIGTQKAGPEKLIGGKGLYDMAGNVWEWCNDWHQCVANPTPNDPPGPTMGTFRAHRGGSWFGDVTTLLRCSNRDGTYPTVRSPYGGFRVGRTVTP